MDHAISNTKISIFHADHIFILLIILDIFDQVIKIGHSKMSFFFMVIIVSLIIFDFQVILETRWHVLFVIIHSFLIYHILCHAIANFTHFHFDQSIEQFLTVVEHMIFCFNLFLISFLDNFEENHASYCA